MVAERAREAAANAGRLAEVAITTARDRGRTAAYRAYRAGIGEGRAVIDRGLDGLVGHTVEWRPGVAWSRETRTARRRATARDRYVIDRGDRLVAGLGRLERARHQRRVMDAAGETFFARRSDFVLF